MAEGKRRRRGFVVAALVVLGATGLSASAEPPDLPPVIDLEVEAGLVGRGVTVAAGSQASGGAFAHFEGLAVAPPPDGVRVAGNRLHLDGAPFVPIGFTMVALAHPNAEGGTAWAASRYGAEPLEAARSWGVNTLRFQVSQRGFDPADAMHSAAYVDRVVAGVALARAHGFVVILSLQDQAPAGGDSHAQPSGATIRAWETLSALFNGDQYVAYEMFNEPQNRPTPDGWAVWRDGGPPEGNQGTPAVGHQKVLEAIRASGSTNVVIAGAGQFGQRLDGIPLLHDPLGQLAYGVHPYLTHTLREPDDWEPGFGFLATQFPVVATEWTAVPGVRFCKPEWETTAPLLIDFLQTRDIGVLVWAFDVLGTVVRDWQQYTPTSLTGFQCGEEFEHGPGSLIGSRFPQWRPRERPCASGLSDDGAVALAVDVARAGTYRLWSRVRRLHDDRDSAASLVQVDDACPTTAWSTGPAGAPWSWRTGPGAVFQLDAGRHTLRFLGGAGAVNLDRVMLLPDDGSRPSEPPAGGARAGQ